MKHLVNKPLAPIIVLSFLLLNILSPRLNAELFFGNLQGKQPLLVYSFVWIPLMEISILIAEHIIPAPAISCTKERQKENSKKEPVPPTEFLLNLPSREPLIIRKIVLKGLIFVYVLFCILGILLNQTIKPNRSSRSNPIILSLASLILLFIKLLPRSDISDLLPYKALTR